MRTASRFVAFAVFTVGSASMAAGSDIGGKWQLTSLPPVAHFDASKTELTFAANGRVAMTVGCNRMSGTATRDGERLTFGPVMSTKMACLPPLMMLEMEFQRAVAATRAVKVEGNAMRLIDANGEVTATFVKKP